MCVLLGGCREHFFTPMLLLSPHGARSLLKKKKLAPPLCSDKTFIFVSADKNMADVVAQPDGRSGGIVVMK